MGLNDLISYAQGFSDQPKEEVIMWIESVGASKLKEGNVPIGDLEHIVDYLMSDSAPKRLRKMSYEQAKTATEKWVSANQKKGRHLEDSDGDIREVVSLERGYRIVELLTSSAYSREGSLMSHCLGGYDVDEDVKIYSLRDKNNNPHATFEVVHDDDEIRQVKGKGNGEISPKYIGFVISFCESIGRPVRASEMSNLGYIYIDEAHVDYARKCVTEGEKIVEISGRFYVA